MVQVKCALSERHVNFRKNDGTLLEQGWHFRHDKDGCVEYICSNCLKMATPILVDVRETADA